jgi:hypothetical protein
MTDFLLVKGGSMVRNPSSAVNTNSAGQEVSRVLSTVKSYYRVPKIPPQDTKLSQTYPIYIITSCFQYQF